MAVFVVDCAERETVGMLGAVVVSEISGSIPSTSGPSFGRYATSSATGLSASALISTFGGVLLVVATFLPMINLSVGATSIKMNWLDIGGDGIIILVSGTLAACAGMARLAVRVPTIIQRTPAVLGLLVVLLIIVDISGRIDAARGNAVSYSYGAGAYAGIVGALVVVIGGLLVKPTASMRPMISTLAMLVTAAGGAVVYFDEILFTASILLGLFALLFGGEALLGLRSVGTGSKAIVWLLVLIGFATAVTTVVSSVPLLNDEKSSMYWTDNNGMRHRYWVDQDGNKWY